MKPIARTKYVLSINAQEVNHKVYYPLSQPKQLNGVPYSRYIFSAVRTMPPNMPPAMRLLNLKAGVGVFGSCW